MIELTDKQKQVLYQVVKGVREEKLGQQTLGGYAGTGKTTLIKYLTKFFPNYAICAYTGKAANVLRKKGINATTIHSRIYKPFFENGTVYWDLNPDPICEGFIVDEASMVAKEIYDDLSSYGYPMIYVGDHGQLEPVDSDFNLMAEPDYTLEEIHRNAGSIAKFAEHLRMGRAARGYRDKEGKVSFLSNKYMSDDILASVDQVICAFNQTRVVINNRIRAFNGYDGILNVGERVMCLRNDRELKLFNGMQGVVNRLYEKRGKKYMDFEFDGNIIEEIRYDTKQFGKDKYDIKHGENTPHPFDYAYCITCHKSQGDEFNQTLVIEQKCSKWQHRRWAYTAASRAREKLFWVLG